MRAAFVTLFLLCGVLLAPQMARAHHPDQSLLRECRQVAKTIKRRAPRMYLEKALFTYEMRSRIAGSSRYQVEIAHENAVESCKVGKRHRPDLYH